MYLIPRYFCVGRGLSSSSVVSYKMTADFPETPAVSFLNADPSKILTFIGASNKDVITELTLQNDNDKNLTVLYKVKCTDNNKFMIPECAGLIRAGESMTLGIKRYNLETVPNKNDVTDKFCIEHLISPTSNGNPKVLWGQAKAQDIKPRIQELEVSYRD